MVENIKAWAVKNLMKLNLSKTKEIVMKGRTTLLSPGEIVDIKRVPYLKLIGVTFQDSPTNWNKHFDDLMDRALKRMHILRVCKNNGYSISDLHYLLNSLIMSLFIYFIRVWGVAAYSKYLSQIDRLQKRALRFGYIQYVTSFKQIIKDKDLSLWSSMWIIPRTLCRIFFPHVKAELCVVDLIPTTSQVSKQRGLRNAL